MNITLSKATPASVSKRLEDISREITDLWFQSGRDGINPNDQYMRWLMSMAADCSMAARFVRMQARKPKKVTP